MHCKHVIFTFCMYFRFKYTPLVNSTMVYEKGSIYLFGIEKFRGKCFLEHFISNFHIFPYNALQTCHFHILYVFPFQIYPPRKFNYGLYKGVYLSLFGIEKFRGKCFLEHFISNFHIFPYNALQTCHLHEGGIFETNTYKMWKWHVCNALYGKMWKFDIKCSKKHFPRNFSMLKGSK